MAPGTVHYTQQSGIGQRMRSNRCVLERAFCLRGGLHRSASAIRSASEGPGRQGSAGYRSWKYQTAQQSSSQAARSTTLAARELNLSTVSPHLLGAASLALWRERNSIAATPRRLCPITRQHPPRLSIVVAHRCHRRRQPTNKLCDRLAIVLQRVHSRTTCRVLVYLHSSPCGPWTSALAVKSFRRIRFSRRR
jgi:hypothetical protein